MGDWLRTVRSGLMVLLREWRTGVLLLLLVGPVLAYIGFGTLWLLEHGWLLVAVIAWILAGAGLVLIVYWIESKITHTTEEAQQEAEPSGVPGDIL